MTPYETENVHFFWLMNSATKLRVPLRTPFLSDFLQGLLKKFLQGSVYGFRGLPGFHHFGGYKTLNPKPSLGV